MVALGLSLIGGNAMAGKVYKWVDEKGVTHYGEQPPTAGEAKTIRTTGTLPSDHEEAVKNLDTIKKKIDEDAQARVKRKEQVAEKEKEADAAATLKKNCDQTRENIKTLQEKARVQETLANGERKYLDENERKAKMEENQKYLDTYCKDASSDTKKRAP